VTTRTAWTIAALALAAIAGYVAGTRHMLTSPRTVSEHNLQMAVAPVDAQSLRLVVREELARASLASRTCATVNAAPSPAPPPLPAAPLPADANALNAIARAHDVIDGALRNGNWGESDRRSLHSALSNVAQADADEVYRQLFRAINEGRLSLCSIDSPL